jgi:curli biogenesis system outer membrane secretion channel CsgG
MKRLTVLTLLTAMLCLSLAVHAQKPRIAVIKIENKTQYWHGRLGPSCEDWLVNKLVNSGEFRVIERAQLESVLAEQGLSLSGGIDDKTAVSVGKLLGCQLILHGAVTDFSIQKAGAHGAFGVGFGVKKTTAEGTLDVRLISTTTAEIVFAAQEKGEHSFSNVSVAGFGGGMDYDESQARQIFEPAVDRLVQQIIAKTEQIKDSLGSAAVLEGKVAKVGDGKVYISIGSTDGVKEGDTYAVFRLGEAIIDPDSGAVLGQDKARIGKFTVTNVVADHLSIGVADGGSPQVGDQIVKE